MKNFLQKHLFVICGWIFTVLGFVGAFLPILPTTPFLIVALIFFSKSSPRFHQMLLDNDWFGPTLKQWEESKTLSRQSKIKATVLISITFAVSIALFADKFMIQMVLVGIALVLMIFIWRIKEQDF